MLGMLAGKLAMQLAVAKAKEVGIGLVLVRNSTDWGAGGYCVVHALPHGCVGHALANSRPEVAPYGGIDIVFGHANYCVAIPAAKHYPILVDMAAVECGGVEGQADILTGRRLPAGIFIDEDGKTVEDASAWGTTGYGLASGGQMMRSWKELCLVVSIEALAGALSGMQCALDLNTPEDPSVPVRTPKGQLVLALDIERFTSLVEFTAKIDRMIDHAKASRPAATQGAVRVPGERGYALADRQAREGISYEDAIWERGCRAFRRAGVDLIAITRNTLT
jgi:L-2-hydroxycarboxylate dehydrogenase (NAD+)